MDVKLKKYRGKMVLILGCMFSGKTKELARLIERALRGKRDILVFKSKIDTRSKVLWTHDAEDLDDIEVSCIEHPYEILVVVDDICSRVGGSLDDVFIDEAQFFNQKYDGRRIYGSLGDNKTLDIEYALSYVVLALSEMGINVTIGGLDTDFEREWWGSTEELYKIVPDRRILTAVCPRCGRDATLTSRKSGTGEQVLVGAKEAYEALCIFCHQKPKKEK